MNSRYKKAQYCIVKSKYSAKPSAKSTSSRKYYVKALLPDTTTYIQGVNCTDKTYKSLEEGNPVLVISFDNKTAHAVHCNVE